MRITRTTMTAAASALSQFATALSLWSPLQTTRAPVSPLECQSRGHLRPRAPQGTDKWRARAVMPLRFYDFKGETHSTPLPTLLAQPGPSPLPRSFQHCAL